MRRDTWVRAAGVEEFLRETIPALAAEPAANSQVLTVFDRLRREGAHAFGERDPQLLSWYGTQGAIEAALLRTPPYPYILAGHPTERSLAALADQLLDPATGLDGREINLPDESVAWFTAAWTARTGKAPRVAERNRLYRLAERIDQEPAPAGRVKVAEPAEVPVVARFLQGFWEEIEHSSPADSAMTARRIATARVAEGTFLLWLDENGEPVSLAGHTPIVAGAGRIGPVYTPPALRRRGYAGAVTVAAGRALLDLGATEVLLFTDLANPTSNALYQRIGYHAVSDRARLELEG